MMYRTEGPTTHVYSGTEYDAFAVGEWREVRSFCPRRHCYVVDLAAPIVPVRVAPSNPGAAMRRERLPANSAQAALAAARYEDTLAERNREREDAIIAAIDAAGGPIPLLDAAKAAGIARETLIGMLYQVDRIKRIVRSAMHVFVGLVHHTASDLPRSHAEQRIIDALTALGEATQEEVIAWHGLYPRNNKIRLNLHPHLVEWREEQRTGNGGRQVYTVRVYRLKAHKQET